MVAPIKEEKWIGKMNSNWVKDKSILKDLDSVNCRTMKKVYIHIAVFLISIIVFFIVIEIGLHFRQYMKYGTFSRTVFKFDYDKETDLNIPKANYKSRKNQINSLGFRSPEIKIPKPIPNIRLAFLGGSTTFCAEVSNNEKTWPHIVWSQLQDRYPKNKFDYINAAAPGYNTYNSLVTLENRVKEFKPDVIVIYHGSNDIATDCRKLARKQGLRVDNVGDTFDNNWFMNKSLFFYLIRKNLELKKRMKGLLDEKNNLVFEPRELSKDFKKRLSNLVMASKNIAPVIAVATMSYHQRERQSTKAQLKAGGSYAYFMPYMSLSGLLKAFTEYNRVVNEVAKETGAILIKGENSIPANSNYFFDAVHFKYLGCELMAKRVIQAFEESLQFRHLCNTKAIR